MTPEAEPETSAPSLEDLVEAMGHPARARILYVISDRPGVTVRQLARRLGETERRVRLHLKALLAAGLVAVEGETRARNTLERRYRVTRVPLVDDEEAEAIDPAMQRRVSLEILRLILADARAAIATGTFGTRQGHSEIRFWAEVDEEGWEELARIQADALEKTRQALRRSEERLRVGGASSFGVTSALLLFEAPVWD